MFFGKRPEVTPRIGDAGNDIGLACGSGANAAGVERSFLPSSDQPDIKGQVRFGQFGAEAVQYAREFKHRAIAISVAENQRAMAGDAADLQLPAV